MWQRDPSNHCFIDDVMARFDGTDLAGMIQRGDISSEEVYAAALSRLNLINPKINAVAALLPTRITGNPSGTFSGVPTFVKDNEALAGTRNTFGSRAVSSGPAPSHSRFIEQFMDAGFSVLGKTSMPELGLTSTTEPLLTGPTRNPWSLEHSSGGSSGGAAALVASGVVPIAHGNDGGGSIRTPASCCGVVGFKPSRGRLLNTDIGAPVDLVCQGVLTRSVRDTHNFLYGAQKYYQHPGLSPITRARSTPKTLKIACFLDRPDRQFVDSQCQYVAELSAKRCEDLGHKVELIPCPLPASIFSDFELYHCFFAFASHHFARWLFDSVKADQFEPITLGMSRFFWKNFYRLPVVIAHLKQYTESYHQLFDEFDVMLCPTNGTPPPLIGKLGGEVDYETGLARLKQHACFGLYQNVAGAPAVSLPMGLSQCGLPIGIQFASSVGNDQLLLDLAYQLEEDHYAK